MSGWNTETMEAVAEGQLSAQTHRQRSGLLVQIERINPRLIYDVGAHLGEDTEFYLKKGFRVVAIEANPFLAEKLREKFRSDIADSSLIVVSSAIAQRAGEVGFYVSERSEWRTVQPEFAERNTCMGTPSNLIDVNAIRFRDVLSEHGIPYYLKIDIKGTDLLCLESLFEMSGRPGYISIESEKQSWQALLHEFELFKKLGYTKFKIVDQEKVYRQKVPKPAAEGRSIDYKFRPGSTGLFGRELPGEWLTMGQALWRYRLIYMRHYLLGDYGVVRKAILRVPGFKRAASTDSGASSPSTLRKLLNAVLRIPMFESLFKSHWYDTHATI
ncbi:MAG: FkbM family methyltransferase [Terracidiphilus sp.]